ncbi:hypothetical protein EVAR_90327_1 [Eumeta japonica]|uniref:Uncharacterized protein n=1 Tax=Eumeta variegata TaxID=151549 RepID=A0A4C1YGF6_EUMVA|nr:hypothetical protein EVAR_90327_1 [Eumeta japonica]
MPVLPVIHPRPRCRGPVSTTFGRETYDCAKSSGKKYFFCSRETTEEKVSGSRDGYGKGYIRSNPKTERRHLNFCAAPRRRERTARPSASAASDHRSSARRTVRRTCRPNVLRLV